MPETKQALMVHKNLATTDILCTATTPDDHVL